MIKNQPQPQIHALRAAEHCGRCGDFGGALNFYNIVLASEPRHVAALTACAEICFLTGRDAEAANYAEKLSGVKKGSSLAYTLLGLLWQKKENYNKVVECLQVAIDGEGIPDQYVRAAYSAFTRSAVAVFGIESAKKMLIELLKSKKVAKHSAIIEKNLFFALCEAQLATEAEPIYRKLQKRKAADVSIAFAIEAMWLYAQKKYREAFAAIDDFAGRANESEFVTWGSLFAMQAQMAMILGDRRLVLRAIDALGAAIVKLQYVWKKTSGAASSIFQITQLTCYQANMYKLVGRYDDAFQCAFRSKIERRSTFKHELPSTEIDAFFLSQSLKFFSEKTALTRKRDCVKPNYSPVFIVGLPRSGTSLLEQILSMHRNVLSGGEIGTFGQVADQFHKNHSLVGCDAGEINSIRESWLRGGGFLGCEIDGRVLTDKMPHNFLHVGLILKVFPDAKFICMSRDVRDLVVSNLFQDFRVPHYYAGAADDYASHFAMFNLQMVHWRNIFEGIILDVAYEDLVESPIVQLKRIFNFVGLSWDPRVLDFYKSERVMQTASRDQVRKPINAKSIGVWREFESYLGNFDARVAKWEAIHADRLLTTGSL